MTDAAPSGATRNYRARPTRRGFTRFEVMAREADRDLIRTLARRLSEEGPEAERIRSSVRTVHHPHAGAPSAGSGDGPVVR